MSRPRIGLLSARLSRANGGVWAAVVAQAALVRDLGGVPVVLGGHDPRHPDDPAALGEAEVLACSTLGVERLAFAPALPRALRAARLDVVHLHGLWAFPSCAAAHGRGDAPLVVSPHGMLAEWIVARGRAQKAAARLLYERRCWQRAAAFHALTPAEAADVAGAARRPAVVIPNPVPLPPLSPPTSRPPVALYLGRIHPKKNLHALVDGWLAARPTLPAGAQLLIAGWGDRAAEAALAARVATAGDRVRFVGALHGPAKAQALAQARFLVLPSFSEGLPMAVLEGWAAGTPALLSSACGLYDGIAAGAAIACGTSVAAVATALRDGFALPPVAWARMSAAARRLVAERYTVSALLPAWAQVYGRLLAAGRLAA